MRGMSDGPPGEQRQLVAAALARLGLSNLVLAVHDPSFPSEPDEDIGHGSPSSRGGRAFVAEVAALGFNGLMVGPQGQVTTGNPSPYDGTVFSRSQLLEDVWGVSTDINTRTVDTHVKRLREALGPYGEAVETVHGYGYRLRDPRV